MKMLTEKYQLANGVQIPKIGFGTWQIPDGEQAYNAVKTALKCGYRHIDTALAYYNEKSVGRAIKDSGLKREDIFITSKLPAEKKSYQEAVDGIKESLANLQLDYLDLYLIHAPWPWDKMWQDFGRENLEVWKAFSEAYQNGKLKAIGVSNFSQKDLAVLLEQAEIKPLVNQIRYFVGHTQQALVDFCRTQDIFVEGYSPLGTGEVLDNQEIQKIAEKYQKSVAQICVRYVLQKGVLPLPKSTNQAHIASNAEVDFEISSEDMAHLDRLKDFVDEKFQKGEVEEGNLLHL